MSYIKATYLVDSVDISKAGADIAIGQSIGNPDKRTAYDGKLIKKYVPKITREHIGNCKKVILEFPKRNFGRRDGINHLMSVLMGGQMDIDHIKECRLTDINLDALEYMFQRPRYGIAGIREIIGVYDRPLVGGIVKPKIGLSVNELAKVVHQMAKGGVDFIKEDEILADQGFCPLKKRLPAVKEALQGFKVIYAPCITADGSEIVRRAKIAKKLGAGAVHLNIWAGFGAFRELRKKVEIPIFFQKSGDKLWTTGNYSIAFHVVCRLINLIGCDFAHVGMHGGYLNESTAEITRRIFELGNTMPSFSCGMNPELAKKCKTLFGNEIMVTSGGHIHSLPEGIEEGVRRIRTAIE